MEKREQQKALELFHRAAAEVPAYAGFLGHRRVNADKIITWDDFKTVPLTSKKNYLHKNRLPRLSWGGTLNKPLEFCASSGSTSEPFYFPRSDELAERYADVLERFIGYSSHGTKGPILVIVGFGMGIWIGGIITMRALEIVNQRGRYAVSILPTGINKEEILRGLTKLSPQFQQTILIGYPPFVKDAIDDALKAGIIPEVLNLRLMFAAEAFNERFRDYLSEQIGIANPCLDTMNIYGTADIGAMAYETPLSILIRRLATDSPKLFSAIFSQIQKTPTLAQYDPKNINFEVVDGQLVLTGDSAVPLVRYALGDRGGVFTFSQMKKILAAQGIDIAKEARRAKITDTIQEQPFVFVYERTDFSVSLYGANIYPEVVKDGLLVKSVSKYVSERFTMVIRYDEQQHQFLEINLEMRKDAKLDAATKRYITKTVLEAMSERSSEFREICRQLGSKKVTRFVFWPAEDPLYFKPGVKQRWVSKVTA